MKKTLFVIGAGKGLGNAVGRKFGTNGFQVVLMARNAASLKEYERAFKADGVEVCSKVADAADNDGMTGALDEAVTEFGTPDVLVYNVGVTAPDAAQEGGIDAKLLCSRYQVDVAGAYNCIKKIATDDFAAKGGAILVTGGGLAMYPSSDYLPLSIDKAALRAMVQALHPMMKERGIFLGILTVCNVIAPGSSCAPDILAEKYWQQYTDRTDWEVVCQ